MRRPHTYFHAYGIFFLHIPHWHNWLLDHITHGGREGHEREHLPSIIFYLPFLKALAILHSNIVFTFWLRNFLGEWTWASEEG